MSEPAGEPGPSGIRVQLPLFEGPLDLLLHLIRTNQMDIFDIPIVEIARQYDDYIRLMEEMNLELAGEFLLMASTLAHIKSKLLLPQEPSEEGEPSEDPRADLTRQLLEHQRFRLAAESLEAMESVQSLVWPRPPRRFPELDIEPELVVDLYALMAAFKRVMDQVAANERLKLSAEPFSVADRLVWLRERLAEAGSFPFVETLASLGSRGEMIACFLALLELLRLREAVAHQKSALGEIWITRQEARGAVAAPRDAGKGEEP